MKQKANDRNMLSTYTTHVRSGAGIVDKMRLAITLPLWKIRTLRKSLIKPKGFTVILRNNDALFRCDTWDHFTAYNIERERELNPFFTVGAGEVFVDVGANYGRYSILVGATCEDAEIIAIEPDTTLHEQFQRNIRLNNLEDNVRILPLIIDESAGKKTFYINRNNREKNTLFEDEVLGTEK